MNSGHEFMQQLLLVCHPLYSPQSTKVKGIQDSLPPLSKKGLKSFLGFISFYRRFIPNMSSYSSCLSDKLKKGVSEPLIYTQAEVDSFHHLKECLLAEPVLRLPDKSKPFVVRSDASDKGVGAVLLQYHDDVPFPVAFASRKLKAAECNYSTIEECLAIVVAVQRFSIYLMGKHFF